MVQQVAISASDEQWAPRESRGRAHAPVSDLIAAARRRLLAGAGARLCAAVVAAQCIAKYSGMWKRRIMLPGFVVFDRFQFTMRMLVDAALHLYINI